jgi:chemotaxis protein MotA
MKNKNMVGLIACGVLLLVGFTLHGSIGIYFNISGLFVVFGGTCGAALISYRYERLQVVARVVISSYRTEPKEPREIVGILVDLAVKSKMEGLLSLQRDEKESSMLFLREALGVLVDGYRADEIRNYLSAEMNFFRLRRDNCEQILRNIADFFPAFGLVGSVVGLVGMLAGVGDTSVILKTVPIALTSTLYGIIISNLFILPFAANLRERTNRELLLQQIIMEGVVAIESAVNPNLLERKLKSFLTPSSRVGRMVSLKKIKKRFNLQPVAPPPSEPVPQVVPVQG